MFDLAATLGETLVQAEQMLAQAGVWAPREDAEALAAHLLGVESENLPFQKPLDASTLDRFRQLIARRAERVPLAYITGSAKLGGIEIIVGPGVFVPRKHTEPLLRDSLRLLHGVKSPLVIDFCTGSGAIALAIAHARPDAIVHAVDCDSTALGYASRNAHRLAMAGDTPIHLHLDDATHSDLFSEFNGKVDLIVTNPPNVAEGTYQRPEWGIYQPRVAIYSGDDGLGVIRGIVTSAMRLLRPGAGIVIEHDDAQVESLSALLQTCAVFTEITNHPDHTGDLRYVTALLGSSS